MNRPLPAAGGLLLVFALALALGCTSAPPASTPELAFEPPQSWTRPAPPTPLPEPTWWRNFDDPTLDDLIREALTSNYDLAGTAARLAAAEARARIAGADRKPSVSAGFDGSRGRQNFIGLPIPGASGGVLSNTSTSLGLSLSGSWEIDLWGRLRANAGAAQAQREASAADLRAARVSLAGLTAKAWFAALDAEAQLRLAEAELGNRQATTDRIRRRYRRGVRSALDLRLAAANEASEAATLPQRRQQVEESRRRLELLLGRYPSAEVASAGTLPPLPAALPAGLPADLLQQRPDLAAAERRLAAAGFSLVAARAALYPQIRLTGSAGRSSNELGDLVDSDFSIWNLAGNLLQPVFQGGRLRAAVELSEAQRQELLAAYSGSIQRAFGEVESALAAELFLDQQLTALGEAVQEAEAARALAEQRYDAGLIDYLTVLETQRSAFLAQRLLLTAQRQRLDARVDLHLALGGDFDLLPPNSPETPSK
ncbi:MAG: efflux transporter outer membrane subunit [Acidobacteriota bacterium]